MAWARRGESAGVMTNKIALTHQQAAEVCDILRSVLMPVPLKTPIKAWVFGSRATGRARPYSDLDILISCPKPLDWRARADLQDAFEASILIAFVPFQF